jgi:hypothetical protein
MAIGLGVRAIVLDATFNNISVISCHSVLLSEETEVPAEICGGCRGRDRMTGRFITTCAISAHHH